MPQDVFRITTAGSVDDGKSTLIARLLLDTHSIPEDQLDATLGANADPSTIADLLDGLESEKEQGITIDVAHRYFDSDTRRYHLSDSPGHEQYTRNMATASAAADAVVLVIDSSAGIKPQTIRHLDIAHRLGIKQFLVVANKIDLVGYSRKIFEALRKDVTALFEPYDNASWDLIPSQRDTGRWGSASRPKHALVSRPHLVAGTGCTRTCGHRRRGPDAVPSARAETGAKEATLFCFCAQWERF